MRSPPPGKSVDFEDFLLICTVFPYLGPFGGGGVKPNFVHKNFMDLFWKEKSLGERQSIAQKGARAIDARNSQPENRSNDAAKTSVQRAPGLSTDEREHPFV